MSTKRIFLGHVLPCISYEDLHAWAAQFGRVIDLQLIRHKGYAFLEFETPGEARRFVESADGRTPYRHYDRSGRDTITVEYAYPRGSGPSPNSAETTGSCSRSASRDRVPRPSDRTASAFRAASRDRRLSTYSTTSTPTPATSFRNGLPPPPPPPSRFSCADRYVPAPRAHTSLPSIPSYNATPVKVTEKKEEGEYSAPQSRRSSFSGSLASGYQEFELGSANLNGNRSVVSNSPSQGTIDHSGEENAAETESAEEPAIVRISNVPESMSNETLHALLSESPALLRTTSDSLGTSYAIYSNHAAAVKAIETHDPIYWEGRVISLRMHEMKGRVFGLPRDNLGRSIGDQLELKRKTDGGEEGGKGKVQKVEVNVVHASPASVESFPFSQHGDTKDDKAVIEDTDAHRPLERSEPVVSTDQPAPSSPAPSVFVSTPSSPFPPISLAFKEQSAGSTLLVPPSKSTETKSREPSPAPSETSVILNGLHWTPEPESPERRK